MKKVVFITTGYMPIPAVNGGAVETLVENLLDENENKNSYNFEVISTYDEDAIKQSKKYKHTYFNFIKTPKLVSIIDMIFYFILVNIFRKDRKNSYKFIFKRIHYIVKTSKILKHNNYDKVIIENNPTLFWTLKLKKNYKKYEGKYYYHLHNEINSFYYCKDIMKNCKSIICISNYIKKYVIDRLSIDSSNTVILKNCIDVDRFSKKISSKDVNDIRKKYNIDRNDKLILYTGRIVREKGILELIKAFKMIKTENVKLIIVGGNFIGKNDKTKFELELEEEAECIKDRIVFTGFVDYHSINKIYAISDIAVLPSMWEEPAGLTVIESLASGLPVITTNSGGIPEYATYGSAIIIDRDSNLITNIAKSIDLILNDEKIRNKMVLKASKVTAKLTKEEYYNNFTDIM